MEDYKKLYEQTQNKMKEFIKRWDGIKLSSNDLFTEELKQIVEIESDNEKIKNAILNHLKKLWGNCQVDVCGVHVEDAINWLEKQRDKDKLIQELGKYKVKYTQEVLEKYINNMSNKDDERLRKTAISFLKDFAEQGYENAVECIDWLEKQGEPNPYSGVSFKYNGHTWGMCARDNGVEILVDGEIKERIFLDNEPQGKSALEAIKEEKVDNELAKSLCSEYAQKLYNPSDTGKNEQKPADKIEPKFKVGDWVVNKFGDSWHIDSFDKKNYQVSDGKGNYNYFPISKQDEMHIWTIQDAKDGDVLFTSSTASYETFIFKSIDEKGNAECYFAYDSEDGFREGEYHFIGRATNCKPATKEQRDLLFQKMKESGYEWDADKKELFHNQNQNG